MRTFGKGIDYLSIRQLIYNADWGHSNWPIFSKCVKRSFLQGSIILTWSVSCIYFWKVPQNIWFEKSPKEDWSSRNNRSFQPWMLRKWSKNYMEWWSRLKIFPWIFGKSFFIKDWTHQSENMAFQRFFCHSGICQVL